MNIVLGIIGLAMIVVLLLDIFRAIVLARRARGDFRLTQAFYSAIWPIFVAIGRRTESGRRREAFLGIFGPLSLLLLFLAWALSLILAFALVRYSLSAWDADLRHFSNDLYESASSFLTIGAAQTTQRFVRWLNVLEAGLGFSFLALVISYLPVFYQSFARRELHISLLDARAGSPPSAAEILARYGSYAGQMERRLEAWEEWAADLMQDELSYPMLAYFRSQHLNQSWVSTLVAITDVSALISLSANSELQRQAEITFRMGRHALTDSTDVLGVKPSQRVQDRLSRGDFERIREAIRRSHSPIDCSLLRYERVTELMKLYEPYSVALSSHLLIALPPWIPDEKSSDNWRIAPRKAGQDVFAVSDPFHDDEEKSA
jgi:hypothetical protein